jgi:hypothetical protein
LPANRMLIYSSKSFFLKAGTGMAQPGGVCFYNIL